MQRKCKYVQAFREDTQRLPFKIPLRQNLKSNVKLSTSAQSSLCCERLEVLFTIKCIKITVTRNTVYKIYRNYFFESCDKRARFRVLFILKCFILSNFVIKY